MKRILIRAAFVIAGFAFLPSCAVQNQQTLVVGFTNASTRTVTMDTPDLRPTRDDRINAKFLHEYKAKYGERTRGGIEVPARLCSERPNKTPVQVKPGQTVACTVAELWTFVPGDKWSGKFVQGGMPLRLTKGKDQVNTRIPAAWFSWMEGKGPEPGDERVRQLGSAVWDGKTLRFDAKKTLNSGNKR